MSETIEVKVHGRGVTRGGKPEPEERTRAACDSCGQVADAVVSTGKGGASPYLCKSCLRERLEQITLSLWMFRDESSKGLPWGKISG